MDDMGYTKPVGRSPVMIKRDSPQHSGHVQVRRAPRMLLQGDQAAWQSVMCSSANHLRFMSRRTFDELSAYRFEKAHKLEAWCPDSDLLAMVTEANDLDIYRADWSKHRSIKLEGDALTLVWRPDGKIIAVGLSSGKICLYHYRDGSLVRKIEAVSTTSSRYSQSEREHKTLATMGPIEFLRWEPLFVGEPMERVFPQETSQRSILRKLPSQRPIPLSITAQKRAQATAFFRAKADSEGDYGVEVAEPVEGDPDGLDEYATYAMTALFASDDQAQFYLLLFAGLQTGFLTLCELMKEYGNETYKKFKILDAAIQLDLGEMTIMASGITLESNNSELLQITLDLGMLHAHAHDIKSLGQKRRPIQLLLKYLKDAIGVMDADSETVYRNIEIARDEISTRLKEKEELETPGDALVALFARHIPNEGLKEYLTSDLRQDGLQRWAASTEGAYRNMLKIISDCFLPCCERLHIHLNDLYGYVQKNQEGHNVCEIDRAVLDACEQELKDMFRFAELLKQALDKETKSFGEFKSFLATIIDGLVPSDASGTRPRTKTTLRSAAGLSKYIRSVFSTSGLRQFFESTDIDTDLDTIVSRPPDVALLKKSFTARVSELQARYSRIFEGPEISMTHSIRIKNMLVLEPVMDTISFGPMRTTYVDEPNLDMCSEATVVDSWHYAVFHLTPQQNQGTAGLRIIRSRSSIELREGIHAISTHGGDVGVPSQIERQTLFLSLPGWIILDICFLNDQELAVCTLENQEVDLYPPRPPVVMILRSIQFTEGFTHLSHQKHHETGLGKEQPLIVTGSVQLQGFDSVAVALNSAHGLSPSRYRVVANWRKKGSLASVHFPTGRITVFDMTGG